MSDRNSYWMHEACNVQRPMLLQLHGCEQTYSASCDSREGAPSRPFQLHVRDLLEAQHINRCSYFWVRGTPKQSAGRSKNGQLELSWQDGVLDECCCLACINLACRFLLLFVGWIFTVVCWLDGLLACLSSGHVQSAVMRRATYPIALRLPEMQDFAGVWTKAAFV